MTKLTPSLAATLDALQPFDGDEEFMVKIYAGESPIEGYSARRLVHDVAELQRAGMLEVFEYDGKADSFDLTAEGRDYRHNRRVAVLMAVGRHVFELVMGATGGLVVWALTQLASALAG